MSDDNDNKKPADKIAASEKKPAGKNGAGGGPDGGGPGSGGPGSGGNGKKSINPESDNYKFPIDNFFLELGWLNLIKFKLETQLMLLKITRFFLRLLLDLLRGGKPQSEFLLFLRAVNAVLSAFFGVRGSKEAEEDLRSVRFRHVVVAGLLLLAVFVGGVLLVVQLVVS